jgi:hypothetical protein
MSNLHDALDAEYASAWRPNPGDKLIGTVTELSEREGSYGCYPIVTVATESGERLAVHAFHEVLANELARVAPKVGDIIGVKYAGKDPDKGYHRYRVRREGGDGGFSWGKYGDSGEPEPGSDVPADTSDLEPMRRAAQAKADGRSYRQDDLDDVPFD